MSPVFMIRHGRPASTWGELGGDPDPGLDETGRNQAQAAAVTLMAFPTELRPTAVVSSPLKRCLETAEPLARALGADVRIEPRVAEIPTPTALDASGRGPWLRAAMAGRWAEIDGDIDYLAWREAVIAALLAHEGAAIFTHYVAINAAVSAVTADERVLVFRPDHASITRFEVTDGRVALVEKGREALTSVL